MSLIVTIWFAVKVPAKVRNDFLSFKNLGFMPAGNADLLIRHAFDPESNKTRNNFLLRTRPIVLAVQIVAGVSFFGRTFGPR